jgi:predicted phage baseplate assembly protein
VHEGVVAVRNPLAAWGGADPEPIELVKQVAPDAFRAETYRAVTEDDYARAAQLLPVVSRSQADFRWTGSWHTVFATVDPAGTDMLDPGTETAVRTQLTRYKLAGYDLEIDPPQYVALHIGLVVCAAPDHFRADVRVAVRQALSAATLTDGTRGLFHPDNFTFGQPLHLSRLYAAVEAVPGVDSAEVVTFHRYGRPAAGELRRGRIDAGRLEVLRLDNDPSFPEHGVLSIAMRGGK